jgi:predicted enzyme related to lactoylglutathione lyase
MRNDVWPYRIRWLNGRLIAAGVWVRMRRDIRNVTVVVRDYDEAIQYFSSVLDFVVVEDRVIPDQQKRWVRMAPSADSIVAIVLGRAADYAQESRVGDQTGGRVFLFLNTDDLERDYRLLQERGVIFVRPPKVFDYGTVAVFRDLYGNLWDLIEGN